MDEISIEKRQMYILKRRGMALVPPCPPPTLNTDSACTQDDCRY